MTEQGPTTTFVGQVERDPQGRLWAMLYSGQQLITREEVVSIRHGRRRVTDMVLAAADNAPVPTDSPARGRRRLLQHLHRSSPRSPEEFLRRNPWRPAHLG